jgi:hypothetical protein
MDDYSGKEVLCREMNNCKVTIEFADKQIPGLLENLKRALTSAYEARIEETLTDNSHEKNEPLYMCN